MGYIPDQRERVREAAKLLDREVPGWYNLINERALRMDDCSQCVLGQVFGRRMETKLAEILGDKLPSFQQYGFSNGFNRGSWYLEKRRRDHQKTGGAFSAVSSLRCQWIEEIADRREEGAANVNQG